MEKSIGNAARWLARVGSVATLLGLAACGGGGGGSPATGTVRMSMIDAQCGYKNVFVNVREVRIQSSPTAGDNDAGWITIPVPNGPKQIDLLSLTNGTLLDLGGATVQAGTYEQLRLVLADTGNEVVMDDVGGTVHQLKTPSAQQSGLKIKTSYTVAPNTTTDYLLDFDACKSIVVAGNSGQWILKPVVRLTPKFTGAIEGFVTTVGTNTSVSAQLVNGEVYRTAIVDGTGKFVLPYLQNQTYTVVITSDGRQTTVIPGVPVGTTTTTLNASGTAIALGTSDMATVAGSVTGAAVLGTGSTATTDAQVSALQSVDGTTVTVKTTNVVSTDPSTGTGTYSLNLPIAEPVKYTFTAPSGSTPGSLTLLTSTTADAGKYTIAATSPGETTQQQAVTLTTAGTTTSVNFVFP